MIRQLNLLALSLRKKGFPFQRAIDILYDWSWIRTLGFWQFDLDRTESVQEPTLNWSFADEQDCLRWQSSGADGFDPAQCELFLELLRQNNRMLIGRIDASEDIPDCYAFCATGSKPMTQKMSFHLDPGEGIIRTVYTREHCRGQGLATRLYSHWVSLAKESGLSRLLVDIDLSNTASIRAAEKAGAVRIPTIFYHIRFMKRSFSLTLGPMRNRIRNRHNSPRIEALNEVGDKK